MIRKERRFRWNTLKLFLVLPILGCAFLAFNESEYSSVQQEEKTEVNRDLDYSGFVICGPGDTVLVRSPKTGIEEVKVILSRLSGAKVSIKGTSISTETDENGDFKIKAANGDMLVFSHPEYISQEYAINKSAKGQYYIYIELEKKGSESKTPEKK